MSATERDCRRRILHAYMCWAHAHGVPRLLCLADMLLLAADLGL